MMYEKNAGWSVNSVCLNSATTLLGDLGHLISLLLTRSTCSIEGLSQVIDLFYPSQCALVSPKWELYILRELLPLPEHQLLKKERLQAIQTSYTPEVNKVSYFSLGMNSIKVNCYLVPSKVGWGFLHPHWEIVHFKKYVLNYFTFLAGIVRV